MAYGLDDRRTIFALATGIGKSAIAVIRISGPNSGRAVESLIGRLPAPRRAVLRTIAEPSTQNILDRGLVLWLPGPDSFTGEDSAELHVHGARGVVAAILRVLGELEGLRPALAGEFARRSLENGKSNLIAVEALGDLIEAETEQQRRMAMAQASGDLHLAAEQWRNSLIDALATIESELDFSDESEAHRASHHESKAIITDILTTMAPLTVGNARVERIREGLTVLIAGPPNAGKSTLLNAIARRDVAIVSERAGTTRDLIEVKLDLAGFPVNLIDTAGIQATDDPVEQEGIRRALRKSADADLILWLTSAEDGSFLPPKEFAGRPIWHIITKLDRHDAEEQSAAGDAEADLTDGPRPTCKLAISARTGKNLEKLIGRLENHASETMSVEGSMLVANERQRFAIVMAQEALSAGLDENAPLEVVADELRRACFALESLMGKVGVEDVLDRLFSRFCIGK
ncbi:tRNA uridine-5-carboxymethylaminomethyl(34) synthesis GTPase MnmE [uncultured Rhodoblastus sp.]|uniref:tRNA uridine-5-carboxymethylaminomethyl(34) synthesis GTPase MnmE n=1 Tax=uncultured Rhodoblastus sp. TaxID=543037 RepID=UPI0025E2F92B|nr:tRNA uridine-5-carboxymethylaminomethyl(34) synthesis GTPase MnmE [uncultured Rhodoblastus sp.]